jgi:flagellar hook protein FlgE
MGIFDALNTAVTGLQSQSFALQNISGNIANAQTTAFKGTDTSFEDLLSAEVSPSEETSGSVEETAGSVSAQSNSTIGVQGDIQSTSVATNMAINGDGFFVVQKPSSFTNGQPTFNGANYYTRAGDFQVQNGYLVNGAGYYLMGMPINPATGTTVGSVPTMLQFQNNFLPAQATTTIDYGANLPTDPGTTNTSDLLNPDDFISNPLAVPTQPATMTGTGATLTPDADATLTGTADTTGYTVAAGGGSLVINGTTVALTATETPSQIATAITSSAAGVTATVNATSGDLVLTSANASTAIDIGSASTASVLTGLGLSAGTTEPNNLLTQNAVSQGQTLIVQFGSNAATTITFGTGTNQVSTLAELQTALSTLSGGTGSVDTTDGDITLTSSDLTDPIAVSGTASPTLFGLQTTSAIPSSQAVIGSDTTAFLNASVGGGAITAYDSAGDPANVQFRWAKVDSASEGTGHADTWNLFYETNSSATGTQPAWQNVGTNFTFGSDGSLSPPISSVTIPNLTVNGTALGSVQLSLGSNGLTQFADTTGTVNVNSLQQNGYAAGSLQTLAVNNQGVVTGAYSNGQTIDLAKVTLASFSGEDYLQNISGGAYAQTEESGDPVLNASGTITPSSLEGSNTDIADEFTQLIVTQQAYSANARVITTANQMLQVVVNMVQ